ncbi:MAG: hypothetical protein RR466_13000, partial [Hungatella sp.]
YGTVNYSISMCFYTTSLFEKIKATVFMQALTEHMPDLLNELTIAHVEGIFAKTIKMYQKVKLLILDKFLLSSLTSE